jgi:hypothetical protein
MRRTYYMRIEIRPTHDTRAVSSASISPVCVASKSVRSRLGIFQVNEWREIANAEVNGLGYELGLEFGRHPIHDWPLIAFIYGSFSKEGNGRVGSQLWRLPCRPIRAEEGK